ncbi:MAG: alpha/beta fold hydrolase [Ralstonia pickettii]
MNAHTRRLTQAGPAGALVVAIDEPADTARGVVVICHPHPLHGGTLDNKVAQTLARAFVQLGYRAVRFNFRGVGGSEGAWDEGRGEVDDALAVIAAQRDPALPLALAGFSFGAYVTSQAAARLAPESRAERLVMIGTAAVNFPVAVVPPDTLVVHGEADEVVPLAAALDWARPQVLPVVVVPGVGHFFHGQLALLKSLVVNAWHR